MNLLKLTTALSTFLAATAATQTIGTTCPNRGTYDCSADSSSVVVCDNTWELQATCASGQQCVFPNGANAPYCTPITRSAGQNVGESCGTRGTYECSSDLSSILVCDGIWKLQAGCGGSQCVWPTGDPTPHCTDE